MQGTEELGNSAAYREIRQFRSAGEPEMRAPACVRVGDGEEESDSARSNARERQIKRQTERNIKEAEESVGKTREAGGEFLKMETLRKDTGEESQFKGRNSVERRRERDSDGQVESETAGLT